MKAFKQYINATMYPYRYTGTRTVRFAFPALALLVSLVSIAALTSSQTTAVRFVSSAAVVEEGERFSLKVMVDAKKPINAVDITIAIPEELVRVVSLDDGESVITIWTEDPFYREGFVYLRGGTYRKGFLGTHELLTIELQAKTAGIATVALDDLRLFAGDGSGNEVSVSNQTVDTQVAIGTAYGVDLTTSERLEGVATLQFVTDIDGDGEVSLNDVMSFMSAWRNRDRSFDFNGDGLMTFQDFAIILADSFFK